MTPSRNTRSQKEALRSLLIYDRQLRSELTSIATFYQEASALEHRGVVQIRNDHTSDYVLEYADPIHLRIVKSTRRLVREEREREKRLLKDDEDRTLYQNVKNLLYTHHFYNKETTNTLVASTPELLYPPSPSTSSITWSTPDPNDQDTKGFANPSANLVCNCEDCREGIRLYIADKW